MSSSANDVRNAADTLNGRLDRLQQTLFPGAVGNTGGLLLLLLALLVLFSVLLPDLFPRITTLQAMMFQLPELGLLTLAMVLPLISGGLNLAIIATTNQAALLMGWVFTTQMPADATGIVALLWLIAGLGAGFVYCLCVGLATGVFVAILRIHPILVTLGTMSLISGVSIFLTRGRTLSGFPEPVIAVANSTFLSLPISFILFLVLAAGVHVLLTQTPIGVRIHMTGSNAEATRYSGVDTRRVLFSVYVLSSLLCWVAAIVTMGRFNSAGADFGQSYLLITILAAILGGVDPYGGFGRVVSLLAALAILQTISSGFNLLGLSQQMTLAFWGVTLIAVMAVKRAAVLIGEARAARG